MRTKALTLARNERRRESNKQRRSSPKSSSRFQRVAVVEGFFLLFGLCVAGRLFYIAILQHGKYQHMAKVQHQSTVSLEAQRGLIYDRNHNPLALNEACISIGVDLRLMKDRRAAAEKIAKVLGEGPAALYQRMKTDRSFVWLKRRVDADFGPKIKALNLPGIRIEKDARRRYPHKEIAAHLLGYTDVDNYGIAGLELACDSLLRGQDGRKTMQRDAVGNQLPNPGGLEKPAIDGSKVVLTIDYLVQALATEELRVSMDLFGASGGLVVVTNPMNGEVLATVCEPSFDPNQPSAYTMAARRNRVITDLFEPGSVFKLVTFAGVIQEKIRTPRGPIFCENGAYKVADKIITDHGERYGNLTVAEVVANSSNIGTFKLARLLGREKFYRYARDLGFGMPTRIDTDGEASGTLKHPAEWSGYSLAAMSMGYEVLVNAMQMAMAYGAIANGGQLLQPRLIAAVEGPEGEVSRFEEPEVVRRVMSGETARTLTAMMEGVVISGTGKNAAIPGVRIAGKTGTAHKALTRARGYSSSDLNVSFAGFFPVPEPRYLIFVMLESPRTSQWGGLAAAPTFKRIAQRILFAEPARHSTELNESYIFNTGETIMEDTRTIILPDFTNRRRVAGEEMLRSLGLEAVWDGKGDFILNQMPPPGATVAHQAKVTLQLFEVNRAQQQLRMPNVVGLSLRQALQQLSVHGIDAHVSGTGRVVQQYPPAGTEVSSSLRCDLRCQAGVRAAREVVGVQ
ncbi:MAG: penicillin-binding transpeptidase domain-containing protein [bacterium]